MCLGAGTVGRRRAGELSQKREICPGVGRRLQMVCHLPGGWLCGLSGLHSVCQAQNIMPVEGSKAFRCCLAPAASHVSPGRHLLPALAAVSRPVQSCCRPVRLATPAALTVLKHRLMVDSPYWPHLSPVSSVSLRVLICRAAADQLDLCRACRHLPPFFSRSLLPVLSGAGSSKPLLWVPGMLGVGPASSSTLARHAAPSGLWLLVWPLADPPGPQTLDCVFALSWQGSEWQAWLVVAIGSCALCLRGQASGLLP